MAEIRLGYEGLGLTTADWDTTLIDSQFDYAADTSWSDSSTGRPYRCPGRSGAGAAWSAVRVARCGCASAL